MLLLLLTGCAALHICAGRTACMAGCKPATVLGDPVKVCVCGPGLAGGAGFGQDVD